MALQTEKQIITIRTLPNISRSNENQTMKFGPLIYITREIFFLKNHAQNNEEKLVPKNRNSLKKLKLSIPLDQQSEVSLSLFLLYVQVRNYQNILKLRS